MSAAETALAARARARAHDCFPCVRPQVDEEGPHPGANQGDGFTLVSSCLAQRHGFGPKCAVLQGFIGLYRVFHGLTPLPGASQKLDRPHAPFPTRGKCLNGTQISDRIPHSRARPAAPRALARPGTRGKYENRGRRRAQGGKNPGPYSTVVGPVRLRSKQTKPGASRCVASPLAHKARCEARRVV